ncbi:MAG: MoxR family ATPase [Euryarchaeota archaeon]|nr:MoxR family ATPase [Euryarchaeota archaeon]
MKTTTQVLAQKSTTANSDGTSPEIGAPVREPITHLLEEVSKVIVGKRQVLDLVAAAILTEGAHILFEDMPGLAKSVMASTFARASGTTFKRVQFTPDLLPADITGTYILDQKQGTFKFHEGPIFTNFLLADEINRASPKTQSALLEAMAEKQATQNPVEQEGTYALPEAQLDRFMIKTTVGYPSASEEEEILNRRNSRMKDDFDVRPATTPEKLVSLQRTVEYVRVEPVLVRYVASLVTATRHHPDLLAGASPRGSLALLKLAKARAALQGRNFVVPDDIRFLIRPVLAHRLILRPEPRIRGVKTEQVLDEISRSVPVPKL